MAQEVLAAWSTLSKGRISSPRRQVHCAAGPVKVRGAANEVLWKFVDVDALPKCLSASELRINLSMTTNICVTSVKEMTVLGTSHAFFRNVHGRYRPSGSRDYDLVVETAREELTYTMAFLRVILPLVFKGRKNGKKKSNVFQCFFMQLFVNYFLISYNIFSPLYILIIQFIIMFRHKELS